MNELLQPDGVRRIESKLASLPTPFTGMQDLTTDFVGPLWLQNITGWCCLEILAPIAVEFTAQPELKGNLASVHYAVDEGYRLSKVAVGYVTSQDERPLIRGRIANRVRIKSRGRQYYESTVRVPSAAENLTILLSYQGQEVDRQTLTRSALLRRNTRMSSVERFDPGLATFARAIIPRDKRDLKLFEEAVRTLFSFAGFSCLKPLGTDSVDILAFTDDPRQVLLIECTTGAPDLHNKIVKLANRRNTYKRTMEPLAIIATPIPGTETSTIDRERAQKDEIIVLYQDDLAKLFDMANRGTTPSAAISYLRTLFSRSTF